MYQNGWTRNLLSGIAIHEKPSKICWTIQTSMESLTMQHIMNMAMTISANTRILCLVIGHGDNRYIFITYFLSNAYYKKLLQDAISKEPETEGSVFVPVILGSDKTTVSVATGQNEYYPLYLSIGNIHNNTRRAHRNGVVLIGFLAIAKSTCSVKP